ncbi:MAG TPA: MutH/Sau3AI family endonuclease [Candidatus Magasanikbacteria bacterium]|nr:MutH/Sau3AI family endonuclease [Candidatus Magasanikbacteria bacterium]
MLSSKKLKALQKYIDIIEANKGKTIGEIYKNIVGHNHEHFKKGASGLIVENLLGLENNGSPLADLADLKVEIKVLPLQLKNLKVKEPTQIKMINFVDVAKETWENAKIRDKIETIFWIVYGVPKNIETKKNESQDKYILLDWFIDVPDEEKQKIFKQDWELIQSYIVQGKGDKLSCSMGTYIEPKTKGKNNKDLTDAPDGKGGLTKVRRRAFYFKKNYTNKNVVPELDLSSVKNEK